MPNRRQAIIWTSGDPIHWRIYVALGGDELAWARFRCPCWGWACSVFVHSLFALSSQQAQPFLSCKACRAVSLDWANWEQTPSPGGTPSLRVSRYAQRLCPPFSASGWSFCSPLPILPCLPCYLDLVGSHFEAPHFQHVDDLLPPKNWPYLSFIQILLGPILNFESLCIVNLNLIQSLNG